jgi:hypothetical protein
MTEHVDKTARIPALDALRDGFLEVANSEAARSSRYRTRRLAAGLAALSLLVALAVVAVTGGERTEAPPATADANELIHPQAASGFVSGGPEYRTLDELVANSHLVVTGTVKEVRSGGEVVDIDPQYPTRFLNAVVAVDEVMKGSAPSTELTVRTIESAYAPAPGGPREPDVEWRTPGERIVAFLAPSPNGGPLLVPTSYTQSFYRLKGADVMPLAPTTGSIDAMPLSQFRQAVRAAAER